MLKVNNKDARRTPMASFSCLYCWLSKNFTPCSNVSIVNFDHVIASWGNCPQIYAIGSFPQTLSMKKKVENTSSFWFRIEEVMETKCYDSTLLLTTNGSFIKP